MSSGVKKRVSKSRVEPEHIFTALCEAAVATHFDESSRAGRVIRLSDELLKSSTRKTGRQKRALTTECLSILYSSLNTRWRYLDNSTGQALKRICMAACEMVSDGSSKEVTLAAQFLRKMAEYVTETLLVVPNLRGALASLLSRPLSDSWLVTTGAVVLSEVVSKGLGVTVTRCGAVVDLHPGQKQGEVVRMYWLSSLKEIITKPLVVRLCRILSETARRCTAADIRVGCTCIGVVSMLLNNDQYKQLLPDILTVLSGEKLLATVLRLTKMAYRLPSPLFLQGANDLLWRYCGADKDKHKDLYLMVFESNIEFEETNTENREAVVECLFWINAFNYPTCRSSDILHAMSWVRRYKFLARLNKYLRRVRFDEDSNWFLLCANTYSNAFHPILYKLATSQAACPTTVRRSFQNDMLESGLLEITQSFIRGLVNLINLKFRDGPPEMSEEKITEGYIIALATSNVVYFYALCMHDNVHVVQYCEVCGALSLIVETLEVSEWVFKASCDADIIRLGARAQEEALGLLCTLMYQKLGRRRLDRWRLDDSYIQNGTYLKVIDLIGRLRPLQLVMLSQRVVLIRKRMELLFYLTHYSKNVVSHYYEEMHGLIRGRIVHVLELLKPQVDNLLQLKATGFEGIGPAEARNIEDIDSYHVLLGHVFNPQS
ncbi:hypothetical protein BSKO_10587 [Bryopsis sp. KO-2023]|nr:hypothetical protein BSKO_10587 [Bryopsis sp. KO-2023]